MRAPLPFPGRAFSPQTAAAYDLNQPTLAGADRDPLAALVFCRPPRAAWTVIAGKPVVREGRIATVGMARALAEHRRLTRELIDEG